MVRALLTAAGGTVAERADVSPTAAKLGVSNFMNIASRWLYSQAPLQTAVWQRGEGGGLGPVFPTPKCQGRHRPGR